MNAILRAFKTPITLASVCLALTGCTATGEFDSAKAMNTGMDMSQAFLLSEAQVVEMSMQAAAVSDGRNRVAPASNAYARRLERLTAPYTQVSGLNLNYKVYMDDQLNAFAMADGTVRVYSGLMDAMNDAQLLGVIFHEIGHVKYKHSYDQMRAALLTDSSFRAVASVGGTVGDLTQSQLGQVANAAIKARFSRQDEHRSDVYAVRMLRQHGHNPAAMREAIEVLQRHGGDGGGFLSTHPSNPDRIARINEAIGG